MGLIALRCLAVGSLLLVALVACGDDDAEEADERSDDSTEDTSDEDSSDSSDEDSTDGEGESSDLGEPVAIRTGTDAREVAVGAGGVWVVDDIEGTVVRIDPETDEPEVVELGDSSEPRGIAATDDAVFVATAPLDAADPFVDDLVRIDPETLEEDGRVPLPAEIAVDGIAAAGDAVWVASGDASLVLEVDADSLEVSDELDIEGEFPRIAAADDAVWAVPGTSLPTELLYAEQGSGDLSPVDLDEEFVNLDALTADGEVAWVNDDLGTGITEICRVESGSDEADCADVGVGQGEALGEENVAALAVGEDAVWIAVSGDAFENSGYRVLRLDPDSLEVRGEVELEVNEDEELSLFDMAVGEGAVWVTNDFGDDAGVFRIDV